MLNYKPKLAEVDPDNPNMWARCDRCGFITNSNKMVWQWDYRGTPGLINTRILTCGRPTCLDVPNPQMSPIILSPDPEPVFNARPYPYEISEGSFLLAEDGTIITTEDGTYLETGIPDPSSNAATAHLVSAIISNGFASPLTVAYLDIFDGDPTAGGQSVLAFITGSATRTDILSQMTETDTVLTNTDTIILSTSAAAGANMQFAAIYDAATGGTLLGSGPLHVRGPFVTPDNPIVFNALDLSIVEVSIPEPLSLMWGPSFMTWGTSELEWGT